VLPPHASFAPFTTPRLALVALRLEHAPAVFAYANDPDIGRMVGWPRHETLADSRRFVARCQVGYAKGDLYQWGLLRRSDRAFLGTCGFGTLDRARGVGEIDYVLAKPFWRLGFATEAAAAVLHFGFTALGLRLIEARAWPNNTASLRVIAKLGLRYRETESVDTPAEMPQTVSVFQIERRQ
jgi:ribosomal-protein-alanine N-acetyltransferase